MHVNRAIPESFVNSIETKFYSPSLDITEWNPTVYKCIVGICPYYMVAQKKYNYDGRY